PYPTRDRHIRAPVAAARHPPLRAVTVPSTFRLRPGTRPASQRAATSPEAHRCAGLTRSVRYASCTLIPRQSRGEGPAGRTPSVRRAPYAQADPFPADWLRYLQTIRGRLRCPPRRTARAAVPPRAEQALPS